MTVTTIDTTPTKMSAGRARRLRAFTIRRPSFSTIVAIVLACASIWFFQTTQLVSPIVANALMISLLTTIGWTLTPLPNSSIAVAAAIAFVATGTLPEDVFYAALGDELVWLLIAAFAIAAVLRTTTILQRMITASTARVTSVSALFHVLTLLIGITAFFIPSTAGRAALLLPVFIALASSLSNVQLRKPLALLFPTAILLTAGGSLIGTGAHLIAVDTIERADGLRLSFWMWILLAWPVAQISAHMATQLLLFIFVGKQDRKAPIKLDACSLPHTLTVKEKRLIALLVTLIAAWSTTALHNFGIAIVTVVGAAIAVTPWFTDEKPKTLFKNVEVELVVFLGATLVIAEALVISGASQWLADEVLSLMPANWLLQTGIIVAVVTLISALAHLFVSSRSARAAILIPAIALPLSTLGHDVTVLVLATVLGAGFCQTLVASAKPLAVFADADTKTFDQKDLVLLAVPLLPIKATLIIAFAIFVWPVLLGQETHGDGFEVSTSMLSIAASASPQGSALVQRAQMEAVSDRLQESNPELSLVASANPQDAAPVQSAQTELMSPPVAEERFEGALCTRTQLHTLMVGTIRDRAMWAAGWWHVWDRLRRNGVRVEQEAVKSIYRGEDMVRLRSHSPQIDQSVVSERDVDAARSACRGGVGNLALHSVPNPTPRP